MPSQKIENKPQKEMIRGVAFVALVLGILAYGPLWIISAFMFDSPGSESGLMPQIVYFLFRSEIIIVIIFYILTILFLNKQKNILAYFSLMILSLPTLFLILTLAYSIISG